MTTMYRRQRSRDRVTHLALVEQAAGETPTEPWMAPSKQDKSWQGRLHDCPPPVFDKATLDRARAALPHVKVRRPLFAATKIPSRAIGLALAIAVGYVFYLLVTKQ